MMMIKFSSITKIFFISLILICSSCALPAKEQLPEQFISSAERDIDFVLRDGLDAASRGRFVDAEFAFRKVLYANPNSTDATLNLAVSLERQGAYEEAENYYNQLINMNPSNVRAKSGLARLYVAQLRYQEAIEVYQQVAELANKAINQLKIESPESTMQINERQRLQTYQKSAAAALRSISSIYYRLGQEEESSCYSADAVNVAQSNEEKIRHSRLMLSRGWTGAALATLGELDTRRSPDILLHQFALINYEQGKVKEVDQICSGLLVRRNVNPVIERDCLWLISLASNYKIMNAELDDLDSDLSVRALKLANRDLTEGEEALLLPYKFASDISKVQEQFMSDSESMPSLIALPANLL